MTEKKIAFVIAALFFFLLLRLLQLQFVEGRELRELSERNRLRVVKLPAPRGIIHDRNGMPLVENMPYFSVLLAPEAAEKADTPAIADFLGVPEEDIKSKIARKKPFEPIRLKEGLSFEEVAYISARLSDYPALDMDVDIIRHYIYGESGAHVIGYLGRLNEAQAKTPGMKEVPPQAFIGQWGVERLFDGTLRGQPGERVIEVDALGRELRVVGEVQPEKGNDITLSIDLGLQAEAERAFGAQTGALVAIGTETGEILALVSRPSFDPNLFARGVGYDYWVSLHEDERHPMLNRALQSQYPPGSVFKVVTAIAALESKALTPQTRVSCSGGLPIGNWTFRCWEKGGHGSLDLHGAIVGSCDVYFYTAGKRAGVNDIARYARELGIGQASGLGLVDEKKGFMPDEQWKMEAKGQPWYLGETYNVAIGQGYVLMTPLQVARLMAAISNGGRLYELSLLKRDAPAPVVKRADISEETLTFIRDALFGVVNEPGGTGGRARSLRIAIAGKTGTSQVRSSKAGRQESGRFKEHAWFGAYAPADKPEVAMAVFVEHGGGGGAVAAPIARRAMESYAFGNAAE